MRRLQFQFLISYAVFGSIGPLLAVFLKEDRGFDEFQIGLNQCLTSLATIISPALVTLLADTRFDSRRLLAVAFLLSATAFAMIHFTTGVAPTLLFYMLHSLAFIPAIALQDGYLFSANQLAMREGQKPLPYNKVRAWGSAGFVLPSLALFFLLQAGLPRDIILLSAMAFGVFSCLHSFCLAPAGLPSARDKGNLPTLQALRVLVGPQGRFFCLGLILAVSASFPYHGFFPLYLRGIVGVPDSAIGLIFNLGVFLEVFYILALGRLLAWLGLRRLMLLGFAAMALRYALLAYFPSVTTSLVVQLLHGPEIAAVFVLPTMFLNQLASDRFRNSIQGVYIMFIIGGSRVISTLIAGKIAKDSLISLFVYAGSLAAAAFVVMLFFFHPEWTGRREKHAA